MRLLSHSHGQAASPRPTVTSLAFPLIMLRVLRVRLICRVNSNVLFRIAVRNFLSSLVCRYKPTEALDPLVNGMVNVGLTLALKGLFVPHA
jgi:hypothetical protein